MKKYWILGIPLAFVSGLLSIVFLQSSGLVQISPATSDVVGTTGTVESAPSVVTLESQSGTDNTNLRDLQAQLSDLRADVDAATQERQELSRQMFNLQQSVSADEIDERFLPGADSSSGTVDDAAVTSGQQTTGNRPRGFRGPNSNQQYTGLIAAGIDPLVAQDIKQRNDQWELARLELIDTAEREGWRRSEEFAEKMINLRDERVNLRDELGDGSYDSYLYLSGENNRVRVDNIITGSAAELSGLEQGDLVLSYASERVYNHRQLQRATRDGARGESVAIEVRRGGQYLTFDVPRGPLGVTLSGVRVDPAN